MFMSIRSSY